MDVMRQAPLPSSTAPTDADDIESFLRPGRNEVAHNLIVMLIIGREGMLAGKSSATDTPQRSRPITCGLIASRSRAEHST